MTKPMLHFLCGKIGAGKSTLAAQLAEGPGTLLIAEDPWLSALFQSQLQTPRDYQRCSAKLRQAMHPHILELLGNGLSVVLDFPANTAQSRDWMRQLLEDSGAEHQMHVLAPPDAVCLARLSARNAKGDHPFTVSEAQFHAISKHFVPPASDEGFTLVHHS